MATAIHSPGQSAVRPSDAEPARPTPIAGGATHRPAGPRKAASAAECEALEQLPNIGPALAADLRRIGIAHPCDLRDKDAFVLYRQLCTATGQRQDPCVLDTFMAVTEFMRGGPAAPWWHYTAQRKVTFGAV